MNKIKKLTSESAQTRIDLILDYMDLPCDASEALPIISRIENDYRVWKKENSSFVKKNKDTVSACKKRLNTILDGYQAIRTAVADSKDTKKDCAVGGQINNKMLAVSPQLTDFQGCFCKMLLRAEVFSKEATGRKINKNHKFLAQR